LKAVEELIVQCEISSKNLYKLTEGLGSGLKKLFIDQSVSEEEAPAHQHVDYFQILGPCKSLQHILLKSTAAVAVEPETPDLEPEFFKNVEWYVDILILFLVFKAFFKNLVYF